MADLEKALSEISRRWAAKAPGSQAWHERARRVIPSGITHDMRRRRVFAPYYAEAQGAYKNDVDGNRYLDLWMGHGALIMGHSYPPMVEAVRAQAPRGTHLGGCHPAEVELAEAIARLVPGIQNVRFVMSGTEATLLAIRLARAATGRPGILKFAGHFHGWHDLAAVGREEPYEVPLGGGVTAGVVEDVAICPADLATVEKALETERDLAAVIMEPHGAHGGAAPLTAEFVRGVRELTRKKGVLLIFDEVVTGFRVARGGVQELYGVEADLVTYAKIIAGGLPGGAVAGHESVMSILEFSGNVKRNRFSKVPHNGTFNSNPLSARAGTTVLAALADGRANAQVDAAARNLVAAGNEVLAHHKVNWGMFGGHGIIHLVGQLTPEELARAEREGWSELRHELLRPQPPLRGLLDAALLINGVDLPTGCQAWPSVEHGPAEVAHFAAALDQAFNLLRQTGALE